MKKVPDTFFVKAVGGERADSQEPYCKPRGGGSPMYRRLLCAWVTYPAESSSYARCWSVFNSSTSAVT